jgi:DNA repair photolyase
MGPRPKDPDEIIARLPEKVIYRPKGQAGEYAPYATNPYIGCGHACSYCYVPRITKQPRKEFDAGAIPKKDYLRRLRRDAERCEENDLHVQIMLSFTTDIYNPFDRSVTRPTLEILQEHGLAICPLTKGGRRALADLDLFRPDLDAFASTLTSLDDRFSRKWERAAALPEDRIATLRAFHDRGIFTWVSLEPTLDIDHSLAVVDATHEFVDLFKVGRANDVPTITKVLDWKDYTLRMIDRLQRYGKAHYIKLDLQPFLPPGYPNPLRIEQHH